MKSRLEHRNDADADEQVVGRRSRDDLQRLMRAARIITATVAAVVCLASSAAATTSDAQRACDDAVTQGYYTPDLYGQCLDDYRDAGR